MGTDPPLRWYTQHTRHWGNIPGRPYQVAYPVIRGKVQKIWCFYDAVGRVQHYFTRYTEENGIRTLRATLAFLDHAVATGLVAPT